MKFRLVPEPKLAATATLDGDKTLKVSFSTSKLPDLRRLRPGQPAAPVSERKINMVQIKSRLKFTVLFRTPRPNAIALCRHHPSRSCSTGYLSHFSVSAVGVKASLILSVVLNSKLVYSVQRILCLRPFAGSQTEESTDLVHKSVHPGLDGESFPFGLFPRPPLT